MPGTRILILSNFFSEGHGGTPESVLLLANHLAGQGIATDVLCNKGLARDAQVLDSLPDAGGDAVFVQNKPPLRSYAALFVAGSWNRRAPMLVIRAAFAGVPVAYAAKGCLCRAEFTRLRDMRRVFYFLLVEWLLLVLARRIVFSSRAEQVNSILPRWLWRSKAALAPEPFSWDSSVSMPSPNSGVVLGFMAEISARKGLLELIAGLNRYLALHPDAKIQLKIAGQVRRGSEAYWEQCRALTRSGGAESHIEWCSPVRGAQRRHFYQSLSLFMCPSRFESFGLTILEALWQGTPVCAAPAIGALEYLHAQAPVLRLNALNADEIARAIAVLAGDRWGWRERACDWMGRDAMTRNNGDIAREFAAILLAPRQCR